MRGWGLAVLALLAVLTLSACDPPPRTTVPADVDFWVSIGDTGGAEVTALIEGDTLSGVGASAVGEALATLMFPDAESSEVSVSDSIGDVTVRLGGVYEPGAAPQVPIDTRDAVAWLLQAGARTVDVSVYAPRVSNSATWSTQPDRTNAHDWHWRLLTTAGEAPHGDVAMAPAPWRGVALVIGQLFALALMATSVVFGVRRRRAVALPLAGVGITVGMATFLSQETNNLEQLGVSGTVTPPWFLGVGAVLLLGGMLTFFGGVPLLVFLAFRGPRRRRLPMFLAPPGWPTPPVGWLPPPGWTPDPDWPPAPEGWQWYRPARKDDPL